VQSAEESKDLILAVLANRPGPARSIAALNAGAAIYVAGLADSLKAGIGKAGDAIESGAARRKLDEYVTFSKGLA
jgi:anthranilate phosphoribosyltransferase